VSTTTHLRVCPLCEATCGLAIDTVGARILEVRGDPDDVASHGYLCPKGIAIADLHNDPNRLTGPLVRRGGRHEAVSWDEAFAEADRLLSAVITAHGREALAVYAGNPNVHNLEGQLYLPALIRSLGTRNVFTASTVDQMPKHVSVALLFGEKLTIPVPDIDRTGFLLLLGADPLASNGSLWTVPDVPGRLRALRARGGRLVVVDPRRSRTARVADTHHFIRPGTDALLLFALVNTLFAEDLVRLGRLADHTNGVAEVRAAAVPFTPEAVAGPTGIAPGAIRDLARDLATAERACVYGRIGTTTQRFGTLTSWLVDVLNVLTGNLDREGGAMFPLAAAGQRNATPLAGEGRTPALGRWRSTVTGTPEVLGELPSAVLAQELEGARGFITVAGNPVLSVPDAGRLDQALGRLDCMISLDVYLNETTRHAHVIFPATSPLQRGHYDLAFTQLAVRNTARWSRPVFERPAGDPEEWEVMLRLATISLGQGPDADLAGADDFVALQVIQRETANPASRIAGQDPAAILAALGDRRGPERLLDFLLRAGPYGAGFGPDESSGLTLERVEAAPHGVDLGPLQPRIPEILHTPSGRIELAPPPLLADVARLEAAMAEHHNGQVLLIGRRQLRSNNSWMHNLPLLAGGTNRCTLLVHPDDAAAHGLDDGGRAHVTSRTGSVTAEVEVTDAMMRGVVSLPHGWGHDRPGAALDVAAKDPGVNTNLLTDPEVDPLSGNAVLNGIPVTLAAAR
jgi:anaerobic selenocysteine-containing dehydrogenase